MNNKPNIIMMISHDTGRHLGCYGKKVATPNIDKLAEGGIKFNNYFCSAPQCSPSRASIITGKYSHNNGMMGLAHLGFSINKDVSTLPMELRKAGYETILVGLSHETIGTPPPVEDRIFTSTTKLGYDIYEEVPGERAPEVADRVAKLLKDKRKNNESKPFYMSVGFFETHRDFDEYIDVADNIEEVEVLPYLPDTEKVRRDIALLNGSTKVLDKGIGSILKAIKDNGFEDNTIIIFTTDHGIAFPLAKGSMREAGLETALIISYKGKIKERVVNSNLLCNIDLMPTLLDMVGEDSPEGIDGKSFKDILEGKEAEIRDEFFCELTWHDRYHPMRGIKTNRYKYVKNFEDGPKVYITIDSHLSLSGQEVRDKYYVPNDEEELYDLEKDPLEEVNLIKDESYSKIVEELRGKVKNWMEETNDPLLHGPIKGHGSNRWAKEIEAGRAYKGRNK